MSWFQAPVWLPASFFFSPCLSRASLWPGLLFWASRIRSNGWKVQNLLIFAGVFFLVTVQQVLDIFSLKCFHKVVSAWSFTSLLLFSFWLSQRPWWPRWSRSPLQCRPSLTCCYNYTLSTGTFLFCPSLFAFQLSSQRNKSWYRFVGRFSPTLLLICSTNEKHVNDW